MGSGSFKKNIAWNLAGNGLPLIAGAVAIPFLLNRLGTEKLGITTLLWTLIGYLSLFDFGLGRALTHLTAHNLGSGMNDENKELLKTSVYLTAILGLVGGLGLLIVVSPLAHHWLNISPLNQTDALYAFAITSLAVPVTTISAAYRGFLEGAERFRDASMVRVFFGIATFLFPVLAVCFGEPSVANVAISLVVARLITLVAYIHFVQRIYREYSFNLKPHTLHKHKLFSFGFWMTLSNIISPLLVSADRFIISGVLGAAVVAYYTVPFEIIVRLGIIPGAIGATLFPRLSACFGTDEAEASRLIRKCVLATTAVMLPLCIAMTLFYVPVISIWMSQEFADRSFPIAVFLAVGTFINAIAYVFYTTVQARNGSRATGILHLLELLLYIPFLVAMISIYGVRGAALAWLVRVTLDCLFLYILFVKGRTRAV
jgi:O-antigen/teichoic acid export membrane protein